MILDWWAYPLAAVIAAVTTIWLVLRRLRDAAQGRCVWPQTDILIRENDRQAVILRALDKADRRTP